MKREKINVLIHGRCANLNGVKRACADFGLTHLSFYQLDEKESLCIKAKELNREDPVILILGPTLCLGKLQVFLSQLRPNKAGRSFELIESKDFSSEILLYWPSLEGEAYTEISNQSLDVYADALLPSTYSCFPKNFLCRNQADQIEKIFDGSELPVFIPRQAYEDKSLKKALFLDRDGVVIKDAGYNVDPEKLELIPETLELMKSASSLGYLVVILTNQSGVARGLFNQTQVDELHDHLHQKLKEHDIYVDGWFSSPYHFEKGLGDYKKHSLTRKPCPGLVLQALERWPIDLSASLMVGDKPSDDLDIPSLETVHLKGDYDLSLVKAPIVHSAQELINHLK
jgi:D-glycero-D-manno-heptose 1,7-bisphosphate phosphatase